MESVFHTADGHAEIPAIAVVPSENSWFIVAKGTVPCTSGRGGSPEERGVVCGEECAVGIATAPSCRYGIEAEFIGSIPMDGRFDFGGGCSPIRRESVNFRL